MNAAEQRIIVTQLAKHSRSSPSQIARQARVMTGGRLPRQATVTRWVKQARRS